MEENKNENLIEEGNLRNIELTELFENEEEYEKQKEKYTNES